MTAKRTIVIGGGVVGLSVAVRLLQTGASVIVIDSAPPAGAASWGNAGHIAIEQVEPLASWPVIRSAPRRLFNNGGALGLPMSQMNHWLPFAARMIAASRADRVEHGRTALRSLLTNSMPAWQRLAADIEAPQLLRETGHFVVWESPGTAAAGLASWRATDIGTARFHECDRDELQQLAAVMKHAPAGAIRFENTGQIADLPKLGETLRQSVLGRGGQLMNAKARRIISKPQSVTITLDDGETTADTVVIAGGVRSKELMKSFGLDVPLIAERGYHIQMTEHRWPENLPPVAFEDRSMIVTGFESGLRAASFVEFGNVDAPPDDRKWQRLQEHVTALGLPCDKPARKWMGARPTLPDYLPAIGRLPDAPNVLYAFGHQHLGLTLAPISGELIAQLFMQAPTAVSLSPFDIRRF